MPSTETQIILVQVPTMPAQLPPGAEVKRAKFAALTEATLAVAQAELALALAKNWWDFCDHYHPTALGDAEVATHEAVANLEAAKAAFRRADRQLFGA